MSEIKELIAKHTNKMTGDMPSPEQQDFADSLVEAIKEKIEKQEPSGYSYAQALIDLAYQSLKSTGEVEK